MRCFPHAVPAHSIYLFGCPIQYLYFSDFLWIHGKLALLIGWRRAHFGSCCVASGEAVVLTTGEAVVETIGEAVAVTVGQAVAVADITGVVEADV